MDLLREINPDLAKKIEGTRIDNNRYEVVLSKTNVPTVKALFEDGSSKYVHSYYDPIKEARRIIENINIKKSPNFLCLGFGLGYHINELIEKLSGNNQIFIIEKDFELFKTALINADLTKILKFTGLRLLVGQPLEEISCNLSIFQSNFLIYGINDLSLKNIDANYYQEILKIIKDIIKNAEVNLTTYVTSIKQFYRNIFENSAEILFSYGVYNLKDKFTGIPAILVSAGPSLEKNIQLLRKVRGKAVFIAVATSVKPLMNYNLFPDFVIALDYNPISEKAFHEIENTESSSLLFDPKVPHSVFRHFHGQRFVYHAPHFLLNWFARISEDKGVLDRALTVSHLAFFLARHMGCSPIIFTGQDLSFTDNSTHAKHTFYMDEYFDEISKLRTLDMVKKEKGIETEGDWRKTRDIFGKDIDTLQNMYSYLQFFENEILHTKSKCIDATEGGAAIRGAEIMPLKEALFLYCDKPNKGNLSQKSCGLHLNFDRDSIIREFISKKNEFRFLEKRCLNIKKELNGRNGNQKKFSDKVLRLMGIVNQERENCKILEELNEKEVISRIRTNHLLSSEELPYEEVRKKETERNKEYLESILEGSRFLQKLIDIALEKVKNHKVAYLT